MTSRALAQRLLLVMVLVASTSASAAPPTGEPPRLYALVVANNQSLDEGLAPLSFADDDGARFFELFQAAGAETRLFTVLDPEAQRRYPEAAKSARPPERRAVLAAVDALFAQMARDKAVGRETHFFFVFSGHGNVGANREGYIHLLDSRFRRSELYRELIARSPASFNHLILDACHAYFLVQKRGDSEREGDYRAAVRDFLRAEELESYPTTGVILAASSESETHEWGQWEAGIFSHELRSALLGAGDVDGDGRVTYAEAAAFVEAANAAVVDPKARLRVFYRPPAARVDVALSELQALRQVPWLQLDSQRAERYHIEDSRGVRVADLHPSREQPMRVALLGQPPFALRTPEQEALLSVAGGTIEVASLSFQPWSSAKKGSAEESFRRYLFATAYGVGFYQGHVTARREEAASSTLSAPPIVGRGERLALLPLDTGELGPDMARNLSEVLRDTAASVGGYAIAGNGNTVDKMVAGSVGRVGDTYQITLKLLDGARGVELDRRTETLKAPEGALVGAVRHLTQVLLGGALVEGRVLLVTSVKGATVRIDGKEVGLTPLTAPIALAAGKHRVTVEAPGFMPFLEDTVVPSGSTLALDTTLVPLEQGSQLTPWAWTAVGTGAAAGIAGGVMYVLASDAHREYERAEKQDEAKALREKTEQRALTANVLLGSAGALVATGLTLFVIDALGPEGSNAEASVLPASNGAMVVVSGRW